jgi:hypothetical protein
MSAGDPKLTGRETKRRQPARVFYVYCIAERGPTSALLDDIVPAAIEADGALEMVIKDDLAAVVSSVPASEYGEEALQSRLDDPTWTALRAMRHEKVVEHFARKSSVVPLRFGTIYLERAGIEQMLSQRSVELRTIIEQLRGREEWGVNAYCDRSVLKTNITALSERLRELARQVEAATPGRSYLIQKEIEALREKEVRAEVKRVAGAIERELSNYGEAATRLRVLKDEGTEHGELIAKLAFLVDLERFGEFREAAERLAREHAPAGFQLELTGPWPAYNFAA